MTVVRPHLSRYACLNTKLPAGCIAGAYLRLGNNNRDFPADETHTIACKHRPFGDEDFLSAAAAGWLNRWDRAEVHLREIAAGENGQHAGAVFSRIRVDAFDDGMSAIGTAKPCMNLIVEEAIVGVAPPAG